jgi:hypothetical protein
MGQRTGKTTDPRYGEVNTYHVSVLEELYKGKCAVGCCGGNSPRPLPGLFVNQWYVVAR